MSDMPRPRGRNVRLLAVLSLLVTFLAGAVVGGAVTRAHDHRWFMHGMPGMGHGGPAGHDLFAPDGELGQRLHLTPVQHDTIERIVQSERKRAQELMREMRPRVHAHFDSTTAAIEAVLTPQQRQEFARFRSKYRLDMHERAMSAVHGLHDSDAGGAPPPAGKR
jgi:Spy/CpxP family protein refolding chaperone